MLHTEILEVEIASTEAEVLAEFGIRAWAVHAIMPVTMAEGQGLWLHGSKGRRCLHIELKVYCDLIPCSPPL